MKLHFHVIFLIYSVNKKISFIAHKNAIQIISTPFILAKKGKTDQIVKQDTGEFSIQLDLGGDMSSSPLGFYGEASKQ